jgi:hypothetical protein
MQDALLQSVHEYFISFTKHNFRIVTSPNTSVDFTYTGQFNEECKCLNGNGRNRQTNYFVEVIKVETSG